MPAEDKREFKILAIDGGGIRGIIPATLLSEIEKKIKHPIWKYFDLICGTSTGGIIALAIAAEKSATEIAELYDTKAEKIFSAVHTEKFMRGFFAWKELIWGKGALYKSDSLRKVLQEKLSRGGQYLKMKDAKTRLCIPAINISTGKTVIFKTPHKVNIPADMEFFYDKEDYMWEIAMSTCAAPFYFKPLCFKNAYFIDGGLWANNPSLTGFVEAIRCGFKSEEIKILSLGTGSEIFQVAKDKAEKMNFKNYNNGKDLIELSFEVQSQAVNNEILSLLPKENYARAQYIFKKNIGLDSIPKKEDLKTAAQHLYKNMWTEIEAKFFTNVSKNPNYKEETNG